MTIFKKSRSLFFHISFRFILLILITILAVGIPAVFFIRYQLEQQLWAEIEQGVRTSQALLEFKELELTNSAKLVSERPTLLQLIYSGDQRALTAYLSTLKEGINHDSITLCDLKGNLITETNHFPSFNVCPYQNQLSIIKNPENEAWFFRSLELKDGDYRIGSVIIGDHLDQKFALLMSQETALDYIGLFEGDVLTNSLDPGLSDITNLHLIDRGQSSEINGQRLFLNYDNSPYYAIRITSDQNKYETILAKPVESIFVAAQKQVYLMIGGISLVICLAVIMSSLIAYRVSQPLEELASKATRRKDVFLETPIQINSHITEVNSLATAFEDSRIELSHSLISLQQEQNWIRHLLEAIAEGIMTLDSNYTVLFFSPAAERITGWKREEVINHCVDEFFKLTEKDELFSDNLPYPGEKLFLNVQIAQNRQTTLSISGAEFKPSEASDSQIALVFRDVTEEVAINRLLGQFLSNVAHEFRTPLSALAASVELLEDQYPDFHRDEVMELIRSQKLGVLGLETLIDNLLESSSIEARRFRVIPRSFDIESTISDVEQTLAPLLEKLGQDLVVNIPQELPLVYGDPRRTVQVLINLLSNAIKYGPENSNIILLAQERDRKVRITVSDHGPGISPEYRQEIFTRFNIPRTESERAKPGAGLGLSVVKAIVEAQGGEVGVEGNPGSGASFWFTMRLAKNL